MMTDPRRCGATRRGNLPKAAALQALYGGLVNGEIGEPKERLTAKLKKAETERLMARFRTLDVCKMSAAYLQLIQGKRLGEIFDEMGV
jgi:hypothetical protein